MSDLLYPSMGSEDTHNGYILDFIPLLFYTVELKPGAQMATVYEAKSPSSRRPTVTTKVPSYYFHHLVRFLWRYYLLSNLYTALHRGNSKVLVDSAIHFLERMLVMLDTVVEQLILRCKNTPTMTPAFRVPAFDDYLVTEFIVGWHDPKRVEEWRNRIENRNLDLERIPPHVLDWDAYDCALGDVLNGTKFNMEIRKVKVADWKTVADALQQ
ncbi:hypothetical protein PAXRUDRAFT_22921, partial [Paxillus rubicundulus Ve08.2h10]